MLFALLFSFRSGAETFSPPPVIEGAQLFGDSTFRWPGAESQIPPPRTQKGAVIVFLSARCPCSRSHEKPLRELSRDFPRWQFIGVHANADETAIEARTHFKQEPLGFPLIEDAERKLLLRFNALKTPHVFVLNPQGEILYRGGVDDASLAAEAKRSYLREALEALEKGNPPPARETRTLGCRIARET